MQSNSNNTTTGTGTTGQTAKPSAYLGIVIESTANNQFDIECYANWEFIGPTIRGKSYNEADDSGVAAALGAVRSVNDSTLDAKHPIVKNVGAIGATVAAYAEKNVSGWKRVIETGSNIADKIGDVLGLIPHPYAQVAGQIVGGMGDVGHALTH